jgi:hypothetical protein
MITAALHPGPDDLHGGASTMPMKFPQKTTTCALRGAALLTAALVAGPAHADAPKTNYILTGFVEETGDQLGYGNYQSSTASSGKQCKATFHVSEGKKFSITKTTVRGPNAKPAQTYVKDPANAYGRATPVAQTDGSGWQSTSNALNGNADHDGTWTVILSYPTSSGMPARSGCGSYDSAVRVVLEATF